MRNALGWVFAAILVSQAQAGGIELTVRLPEKVEARSAVAMVRELKVKTPGVVKGRAVTFADLLPDVAYDLTLTLADGTTYCGADMAWYNEEPANPEAGPLDEDDRKQIQDVIAIPSFYDRSDVLRLCGSHERAVVLVQLIRTKPFVNPDGSAAPGQVVWRVELWYFRNQAGGWEKIRQAHKVLRREQFSRAEFDKALKIKWMPELGGIRLGKETAQVTITPSLEEKH